MAEQKLELMQEVKEEAKELPQNPNEVDVEAKPKICLVNFTEILSDGVPLGIPYISASLKKAGYPVKVLDFNAKNECDFDVSEFDVVGFSLRIEKSLAFYLRHIERIKSTTDKIVIAGGPLVSAWPEKVLLESKVDYICVGEGEYLMVSFMEALKEKNFEKIKSIPGLGYRDNGRVVINPPGKLVDPNSLPPPDYDEFDMEMYLNYVDETYGDRVLNLYSSRGCPFGCKFCYHTFGKIWRGQSSQKLVEDLKYFKEKYNIKTVLFHDEVFIHKRERIMEFCDLVKPLNIKWFAQSRANNIDEEVLRKIIDAGCVGLKMGLESGSERMVKLMNKGTTVEIMWRAIECYKKVGMPVLAGFMFGMPGETLEDAKQTLKFMKKIYKNCPGSYLRAYFYTPRPNTPWYDEAIKGGMKEFNLKDLSNVNVAVSLFEGGFFNTSEMTDKQIKAIIFRTRIWILYYTKLKQKGGLKELGKYIINPTNLTKILGRAFEQLTYKW